MKEDIPSSCRIIWIFCFVYIRLLREINCIFGAYINILLKIKITIESFHITYIFHKSRVHMLPKTKRSCIESLHHSKNTKRGNSMVIIEYEENNVQVNHINQSVLIHSKVSHIRFLRQPSMVSPASKLLLSAHQVSVSRTSVG